MAPQRIGAREKRTHGGGIFRLFTGLNQAFFMGLLFLLARRFTPGAVQRRGARAAAYASARRRSAS